MKHLDKKNNFCKNLQRKNNFLDKVNKMLVSLLDKNNMKNFFELNGEIKKTKNLKNIFLFLKKNILNNLENIYQSVINDKNKGIMTKNFLSIEKIKKQFDNFEHKLLKIENIKNSKYDNYKQMCIQ